MKISTSFTLLSAFLLMTLASGQRRRSLSSRLDDAENHRELKTDGIDETNGIIRGMGLRQLKMGGMDKMGDMKGVMMVINLTSTTVAKKEQPAKVAALTGNISWVTKDVVDETASSTGNMMGMMMRRKR